MTPPRSFAELGLDEGLILGPPFEPSAQVERLTADSRKVGPGVVFAALRGVNADGAAYAKQAVEAGASAVLCDLQSALRARADLGGWPAPFIIDENPRRRLARAAAKLFGPQPQVLAAVTGTNGKTSVASFLRQIWEGLGLPAASFGTAGVFGPGINEPGTLTTPEPVALHALLARLRAQGADHCAMEASSHGLAQRRLDGVRLSAAAFTNLTRDHLDYHASFEEYAAAKLRLFSEVLAPGACAALNADADIFAPAAEICAARKIRVLGFGRNAGAGGLKLLAQDMHLDGQQLRVAHEGREYVIALQLAGAFQGENALAAAAMAIGCGAAPERVFAALEGLTGVRGRMELAGRCANGAGVYVDYAHTPDAVTTALRALRPHVRGQLHVVLGAGGDRDAGKRPLMGAAAAQGADVVIITDDNPRSEDPATIRAQVLAGAPSAFEVGDRAEAILRGVDGLAAGDALLIAGKGHEQGQEIAGRILPFDDVSQAQAAIAALDGVAALED